MTIKFELRRIILFTTNMEEMTRFYRDVIGLGQTGSEEGWRDFAAGACNIALHQGRATPGNRPPKIVFYAKDVAAARAALIRRGAASIGKVKSGDKLDMCDGRDPDGNPFQLSTRA
jgi:catechol 2,3-dioxygenase-like lactoylglutathione lyase family enzyme